MVDRLPPELPRFVDALESAWGANLISVVLFGSWARGEAFRAVEVATRLAPGRGTESV